MTRGDSFCYPPSLRTRAHARRYSLCMSSPPLTPASPPSKPPTPRCGAATKAGGECRAKATLDAAGVPGPCPLHQAGGPSLAVLAARAKGLGVMHAERERLDYLRQLRADEDAARAARVEQERRRLFDPQGFAGGWSTY